MRRPVFAAPPVAVDITWMSIANMYYELGPLNIVTDGYITRLSQAEFFGGGNGFAQTRRPLTPNVRAVTRVMNALEAFLNTAGVTVMKPLQYMDKWRLDRNGVRPVSNAEVKKALGFN